MLHVYGWRRDGGPYFLDNPRTLEDGIAFAETVLKDCRRGFLPRRGQEHQNLGRPLEVRTCLAADRRPVNCRSAPPGIDF